MAGFWGKKIKLHISFWREVYVAQIPDFSLIPNMSLACMPGPCGPKKKKSFCSNLLLCQHVFSRSLQPILFVRKWVHYGSLIFVVFLQCRQKVKRSYPHILPNVSSSRVATTKISARLANTNLGQKKKGYERFTFCQRCKKTGHKFRWAQFLTKRIGSSVKTTQKNAKKWQSNRFLQNDAFFGDQGPSMQARLILRKK